VSSGQRGRIVELDKQRVWRPYTEMRHYRECVEPLVVTRASGSRLFDLDGRSYLDGNASWWACALGHGHPRLVEALRQQADRLCHTALAGVAHEGASTRELPSWPTRSAAPRRAGSSTSSTATTARPRWKWR
jgi:adenosylmethionine-8-amino-7-oxononanoate aminotransferase